MIWKSPPLIILTRNDNNSTIPSPFQPPKIMGCCAPCIFIRRSTALHKFALTAATLIVTSLLVISPIIFLISSAPSNTPKECLSHKAEDCSASPPPPECSTDECRVAALMIQSRIDERYDPCRNFRPYSCASSSDNGPPTVFKYNNKSSLGVRSTQEAVHLEMLRKLESYKVANYSSINHLQDFSRKPQLRTVRSGNSVACTRVVCDKVCNRRR